LSFVLFATCSPTCAPSFVIPATIPNSCLFTPPADTASAKPSRLPPLLPTRHRAFHRCYCHCCRVAIAPSVGVASPLHRPSLLPSRHPSPSSPSHRRRAVHCRCCCPIHCHRHLCVAITLSIAVALPLCRPLPSPLLLRRPSVVTIVLLLHLPSPLPLRCPSPSPSRCDVFVSAKQKLFEWGAQMENNE
jgi:hypothetical protein